MFLTTKQSLGLDPGQSTVKGVVLRHDGRTVELVDARKLDCRAEGLLGEDEVTRELSRWLHEFDWEKIETTVAVPQYLASTQISDFPPHARGTLSEMVKFETQHLAGLSGEEFIYDFAEMPPRFGRSCPVLIGMCRESLIAERTRSLLGAGVRLADFAISGPAMAAAYFHLFPDAAAAESQHLLLDIGAESTNLVIVAGGDVLFTSSLMLGADAFSESPAEGGGAPKFGTVNAMDRTSPFTQAAGALVKEIKAALENWQSDEQSELSSRHFSLVALCGGGAKVAGLELFLGHAFGCPAQVFGVQVAGESTPDPTLVTAFGLALQGLGQSSIPLSLAPREVRYSSMRRRRFGWLVAAATLLVLLLFLVQAISFRRLNANSSELARQIDDLARCSLLIPELETLDEQIEFHQRTMYPFVAKGNRAQRFMRAVAKLERSTETMLSERAGEEGWVVYLADGESFERGKPPGVGGPMPSRNEPLNPFAPLPPPATPRSTASPLDDYFLAAIPATAVQPLRSMVVGVYTTAERQDPYRLVRRLVETLRGDGSRRRQMARDTKDETLFGDVDLMAEREIAGREDIFSEWTVAMRRHGLSGYRRFILRLPFGEVDVLAAPIENQK